MKRYLDLIPISAKIHKKQSKMTRVCIVLAVFLVMAIFSMADMEIRSQYIQAINSDGNWHAMFKELSLEQAAAIKALSRGKSVNMSVKTVPALAAKMPPQTIVMIRPIQLPLMIT